MGRGKCHVISKSQLPLTGPGRFISSVHTKSIVSFQPATRGAYCKIRSFLFLFAFLIFLLQIIMECRLLIAFGGEGLITRVPVLYDTGSNVLSLFERDLAEMATPETLARYRYAEISYVLNSDGLVSAFPKLWVEYRFCNPEDGTAWSAWMTDEAIIRPFTLDNCRLSGSTMNGYYYFGTGPTTPTLSVAPTKGVMSSQLR